MTGAAIHITGSNCDCQRNAQIGSSRPAKCLDTGAFGTWRDAMTRFADFVDTLIMFIGRWSCHGSHPACVVVPRRWGVVQPPFGEPDREGKCRGLSLPPGTPSDVDAGSKGRGKGKKDMNATAERLPEPEYFNDASVFGEVKDDILSRTVSMAYSRAGAKTAPGRWRNVVCTVRDVLNHRLTVHPVAAQKDGECMLAGSLVGFERKTTAVDALYWLTLDLDTGEDFQRVRERVEALGWFAVLHTSWSNQKGTTDVKKDAVLRWLGNGATDATRDDVCNYLLTMKRYRPHVLDGAELVGTVQTDEGFQFRLHHRQMTKMRVWFLLDKPYCFAERGATHAIGTAGWKDIYRGVARILDVATDRACLDPARLWYAPRHPDGAEWRCEVVAGKALDVDAIERVTDQDERRAGMGAFEQAAADMSVTDYRTAGLKRFTAKYADRFDAETFMLDMQQEGDRGSASGGRTHRCPGDDDHSNAGDESDAGFFVVNGTESSSGGFVMSCRHDACAGRDRLALLDLFCEQVGINDAEELRRWVPAIVGDEEDEEERSEPAAKRKEKARDNDYSGDNEKLFQAFSAEWAYVAEGPGGRFVKVLPDGNLEFRGVDALAKRYAHKPVVFLDSAGKPKQRPLVAEWLRWTGSEPRKFDGLRFAPGKQDDQIAPYLNTWRGLGVVPKPGSWVRMRTHIERVLTAGNEKDARFLFGWMAHVLQHLGDTRNKLTISPVVRGEEGAGKSIVFDYYRRIFGRHGVGLSKPEQIVGRFNASLAEALVVQLEEAFFAGDPKIDGPLKDLLTGREITIERKNIDPITAPNFAHFVVISNAERPVPIKEGSRRYYPIECSSAKANDPTWFDPIREEMEKGGIEAMAWDLLRWTPPGGDWGFLREFPRTDAGDRMIAAGLSPLERFILEWAHEGGCGYGFGAPVLTDGDSSIATAELAKAFSAWAEDNVKQRRERDSLKTDAATVGIKLKAMLPQVRKDHREDGNCRLFPARGRVVEMLRMHPNGGYGAYLDRLTEAESDATETA